MDETNCLTHKTIPNGWGTVPIGGKAWRKTRLQEYFIGFGVSLPLHKKQTGNKAFQRKVNK